MPAFIKMNRSCIDLMSHPRVFTLMSLVALMADRETGIAFISFEDLERVGLSRQMFRRAVTRAVKDGLIEMGTTRGTTTRTTKGTTYRTTRRIAISLLSTHFFDINMGGGEPLGEPLSEPLGEPLSEPLLINNKKKNKKKKEEQEEKKEDINPGRDMFYRVASDAFGDGQFGARFAPLLALLRRNGYAGLSSAIRRFQEYQQAAKDEGWTQFVIGRHVASFVKYHNSFLTDEGMNEQIQRTRGFNSSGRSEPQSAYRVDGDERIKEQLLRKKRELENKYGFPEPMVGTPQARIDEYNGVIDRMVQLGMNDA